MIRFTFFLFLTINSYVLSGQNFDLIITTDSDSILCKIESITADDIFFTARKNSNKISSNIPLSKVSEYSYNTASKKGMRQIPGTIYYKSTPPVDMNKNTFFATIAPGGYSFILGSYERMIFSNPESFITSSWLGIGGGVVAEFFGDDGLAFKAFYTGLTGPNNNHLEFNLGITYMSDVSSTVTPLATVGYRYQKANGHFLFRIGGGWPENVFLSLGLVL
jgi:hypothetical protein